MRSLNLGCLTLLILAIVFALSAGAEESPLAAARQAFEKGEFSKAIAILEGAAAKDPNNGDIQLLLTKTYIHSNQSDAAIKSAEKAVSTNPNNSEYHNWLGQAYGDKASHASMFSAYPLARKTQKEFETAVKLDEHNFDAAQNLVDYDCTAPSVVGGGEDKAQPIIQKLLSLDPAQGYYAAGNCRLQKKDYANVDAEFTKSLDSRPKSINLVCDIAEYFADRGQGDKVLAASDAGEAAAPGDPRVKFYRAVGWILRGEKPSDAEKNLKDYLPLILPGLDYPSASTAHYWLGRLYESQKNSSGARLEYETALKLNPKNKQAQEALKKLGSN
jgi:tetratricopeptide (TPR) repeat protein